MLLLPRGECSLGDTLNTWLCLACFPALDLQIWVPQQFCVKAVVYKVKFRHSSLVFLKESLTGFFS